MLTFCDSPTLLPAYVTTVSARFAPDAVPDHPAEIFGVRLPPSLTNAIPQRRLQFAAGRRCAARALCGIIPGFAGEIESAADRSPRWPAGVVGSITHTDGYSWAAVAPATRALGIGIDSERILTSDTIQAVREVVAADVHAPPDLGLGDEVYYALQFSAKESLFKCLYPLVRHMFFFEHARVTLLAEKGRFRATLLHALGEQLPAGLSLDGRYVVAAPLVHTALVLER